MKVKLAPQLWRDLWLCTALELGGFLFLVYAFFGPGDVLDGENAAVGVMLALANMCFLLPWVVHRKMLVTIQIEDNVIRSWRFGKMKCEIHTDREMYYTIFESFNFPGAKGWASYIVLSNEPFMFHQCAGSKGVLDLDHPSASPYDMSKQIIAPYNQKTIPLLPVENWQAL